MSCCFKPDIMVTTIERQQKARWQGAVLMWGIVAQVTHPWQYTSISPLSSCCIRSSRNHRGIQLHTYRSFLDRKFNEQPRVMASLPRPMLRLLSFAFSYVTEHWLNWYMHIVNVFWWHGTIARKDCRLADLYTCSRLAKIVLKCIERTSPGTWLPGSHCVSSHLKWEHCRRSDRPLRRLFALHSWSLDRKWTAETIK